jgi:hypothetical protein
MVLAHSIAKDLDLNVFDQYARDRYRDFIDTGLKHHAKPGIGYKKWYSIHLPGTALTISPFFLFKIPNRMLYFLLRAYMGIFGALVSLLLYLFSQKLWKNNKLSLFISAVFSFSTPILFLSIHIYPEIQVLMLLLASLYLLLFVENKNNLKTLAAGFLLSITVFWGLKYAIFVSLFTLGFMISYFRKKKIKTMLIFIIFPLLCCILFLSYLHFAYGSFSPNSIYYGVMTKAQKANLLDMVLHKVTLKMRLETILDYFFDQRDGLLLYNPLFFFIIPGLFIAFKKFRIYKNHLLISIPSLIYLLYHGFSTVRAGYCPQARYLTPIIWTLILFVIIYYLETENKFFKKLILFLPFYSIFIAVFQLFNPLTLYQPTTHDTLNRSGLLFQQFSNLYLRLNEILPSFLKTENNEKFLPNLVFIFLFITFIVFALRKNNFIDFRSISLVSFFVLFFIFSLVPRIPLYNPTLIMETGDQVHLIYNANHYPARSKSLKLKISDLKYHSYTISTLKEANRFILESKSLKRNLGDFDIYNFDNKTNLLLKGLSSNKTSITNPVYLKRKGRYYYRFTLRLHHSIANTLPFSFKIFPQDQHQEENF